MLLDGENQCGDDLDDWFHFALNVVVSVIQIVFSKDGYGPKGYGKQGVGPVYEFVPVGPWSGPDGYLDGPEGYLNGGYYGNNGPYYG